MVVGSYNTKNALIVIKEQKIVSEEKGASFREILVVEGGAVLDKNSKVVFVFRAHVVSPFAGAMELEKEQVIRCWYCF